MQTRDLRSKFPELDNHIKDTIKEKRQKKLTINFEMIQEEALKFVGSRDFKASSGWWRSVRKRINVVMRASTHIIEKLSEKSGKNIKPCFLI